MHCSYFFKDWKNVQIILGKMGKESIKRKLQELKVEKIPLDVALGARDLIRDFTLDQVRMVSAGGATFYVWVSVLRVNMCFVVVVLKIVCNTYSRKPVFAV